MILRSWIRPLFTRPVTRPIRKVQHRFRLALEVLEDRTVPSKFTGTCPLVRSTTQTPQVRSSSASRSVIGMPLKTADSRTCDRPTKARSPTKSSPRVNPGTAATASYRPIFTST